MSALESQEKKYGGVASTIDKNHAHIKVSPGGRRGVGEPSGRRASPPCKSSDCTLVPGSERCCADSAQELGVRTPGDSLCRELVDFECIREFILRFLLMSFLLSWTCVFHTRQEGNVGDHVIRHVPFSPGTRAPNLPLTWYFQ